MTITKTPPLNPEDSTQKVTKVCRKTAKITKKCTTKKSAKFSTVKKGEKTLFAHTKTVRNPPDNYKNTLPYSLG